MLQNFDFLQTTEISGSFSDLHILITLYAEIMMSSFLIGEIRRGRPVLYILRNPYLSPVDVIIWGCIKFIVQKGLLQPCGRATIEIATLICVMLAQVWNNCTVLLSKLHILAAVL
jgi:hypothetical protein